MCSAASTLPVSISRSNVILTWSSTATCWAPSAGSIAAPNGGPTVLTTKSGAADAALPERSWNPAANETLNCVDSVSFAEGVKIADVLGPFQEKVPVTGPGVGGLTTLTLNLSSTERGRTGSRNASAIALRVW